MVVLTIAAQKNGETIYFDDLNQQVTVNFDQPIPKVHYMRLVSCSLYNSWHNLKRAGQISSDRAGIRVAKIPQGNYNLASLVKELKSSIREKKGGIDFQIEAGNPNSALKLFNPVHDTHPINISQALASLLGTGTELGGSTYVKKLNTPSAYFIHCNLIDKTKNFFNGKRSDVLAKIDIRDAPYDKVTFPSLPQDVSRECSTGEFVNKITLSVKDEDSEMFDFNGLPIEFVLELN